MLSVFLYKNRKVLTLILLLVMSFIMMTIGTSSFSLNFKKIFLTVIYPFEYVTNSILSFIKGTWRSIGQLDTIRQELNKTRKRLQELEQTSGDFNTLQKENLRLRRLLSEKSRIPYTYVLASVVAKDPQNLYQSIIVNKGSTDGIQDKMPVIAYKDGRIGVVGKVVETTLHACKISTIREANFYIGVILETSRYSGLVNGRGMSKTIRLEYIDINAPIQLEDNVITSSHSDIFPKGLSIGKVKYIDREMGKFFLTALIEPSINFAQLEDVYIIKRLPSKEIEKLKTKKNQ
ncbi:MAG: rod shape-determining protein MreC [Spirochaetes bacterium]|nr:rod shape-determining protein MreC [Spirochaetota bacterium]MCK5267762.1 rod shape-determining protein MreC [Spirochaetota bacterium]